MMRAKLNPSSCIIARSLSRHSPENFPLMAFPSKLKPRQRSRGRHAAGLHAGDTSPNTPTENTSATKTALISRVEREERLKITMAVFLPT